MHDVSDPASSADQQAMLLKVVVLLLFVLGPPAPAGSERNSRKYFEVEIQDDEYDDGDDESELLGQSPWLAYDQQLQLAPEPHNLPAGQAFDLDGQQEPAGNEMSAEAAAAILARVQAAANRPEFEPNFQEPSSIGYWSGTADMGAGMLGTASDAAAMQFVGVSSPADELQILQQGYNAAPPFQQPLSAQPLAHAPAPADQPGRSAHAAAATQTPPPAPPMVLELSPAPATAAHEAQLPDIGLEGLEAFDSPPAPPFIAPGATHAPVKQHQHQQHVQENAQEQQGQQQAQVQQQQQGQQQQHLGLAEGTVKVSLMGRSIWHEHGNKASFPTDPQVPPALAAPPASFCDPERGLEPTDDGRCICAQGFGTNADMRTCSRCPVGWYSRGGQVGIAFCKPCPQLSTSNPSRTACVVRRSVIRPDIPKSLCEPCPVPTRPFDPPLCCPRGQVCCGKQGCCPSKRCINNATTNFEPECCGDDCNVGKALKCCPGGQICVNVTGTSGSQSCCAAGKVCGDTLTKSCCNANQECCGNRDCCNVGASAFPQQTCTPNNITGPPANDLRCCLPTQINCNGTCCTTQDSPPSQQCLVDATGIAQCCNIVQLCQSAQDGITQCCSASGQVCTRNTSTTGQQIARCCPAGFSLCPKNSFQPICCAAGRCPSPSSAENCLQS